MRFYLVPIVRIIWDKSCSDKTMSRVFTDSAELVIVCTWEALDQCWVLDICNYVQAGHFQVSYCGSNHGSALGNHGESTAGDDEGT